MKKPLHSLLMSSSTTLAHAFRTVLPRGAHQQVRVTPCNRLPTFSARHYASEQAANGRSFKGSIATHLLAGVAGGGCVIVATYVWYHFSGIRKALDSVRVAKVQLEKTKALLMQHRPNSIYALSYLRQAAKAYVAGVPGAGVAIDALFNSVDEVVAAHSDEAGTILTKASEDLQEIIKDDPTPNNEKAMKILLVLGRRMNELRDLGAKAGASAIAPITERHPIIGVKALEIKQSISELQQKSNEALGKISAWVSKSSKGSE